MKNIKKVCNIKGIAIRIMCKGFDNIMFPWKLNNSINVNNNPITVILSNLCTKILLKYSVPFLVHT